MHRPRIARLALAGVFLGWLAAATATPTVYDADAALDISQGAIGRQIGGYELLDRKGQAFRLEHLRGRPVVVSMIYTSCHHVCPMTTEHLAEVVEVARDALGEDSFSVVSIGFDTAVDSPGRMRQFAIERGIDIPDWYFLSGDEVSIAALAADLGFLFFRSPKGFDHLSQTTVLDDQGHVYRQVYGQAFEKPALVEPLKELVFNTPADAGLLAGWLDNVRLFCTVYDPRSDRYRFDYSIFVGAFVGIICLGAVAIFLVHSWRNAV